MDSLHPSASKRSGFSKLIPSFLTKKSAPEKVIGRIKSSIFAYITPLMIIIAIVITTIVGSSFSTLVGYFNTNAALNGLIIFLIHLALFNVFRNNFNLYRTAKFMKTIEKTMEKSVIKDEDVAVLHHLLEKRIPLLNTKQMQDCLSNLSRFGHPNFTDKDAMLIKSKLGYRLSLKRSDINFNAGILVMLGLLGTFLGLLTTIDAVGEALNSMSSIGGDGGEITMETMSNFIGSLAAPLQGMGLAFSSSLFGLSGSLLVGFFSHLSTGAQNDFIENASRWIDNRIPKFDPEKSKKDPTNKPADQDDLKHWLTGYVHLSVKTNKQLAHLSQTILSSLEQADATRTALTAVASAQENLTQRLDGTMQGLDTLNSKNDQLISGIAQSQQGIADMKASVDMNTQEIGAKIDGMPGALSDVLNQSLSTTLDSSLSSALNQSLTEPLNGLNGTLNATQDLIAKGQAAMASGQSELLAHLKDMNAQGHTGLKAVEMQIAEARGDIDAVSQAHTSRAVEQLTVMTRLENVIQTGLSEVKGASDQSAVSGQLSDIHQSLMTLNKTLEGQSELLSNMPAPTVTMPDFTPILRAASHSGHDDKVFAVDVPSSSADTEQLQEDNQSMMDDIKKDEANFFKNFFGLKSDKDK